MAQCFLLAASLAFSLELFQFSSKKKVPLSLQYTLCSDRIQLMRLSMVRFQEKSLAFVLLFLSVYYLPAFAQHHDKSEQAALCDFITSTNIGVVASS